MCVFVVLMAGLGSCVRLLKSLVKQDNPLTFMAFCPLNGASVYNWICGKVFIIFFTVLKYIIRIVGLFRFSVSSRSCFIFLMYVPALVNVLIVYSH